MEIHSVANKVNDSMMEQVKAVHVKRVPSQPFQDPIREFHRASQVEGTVRNWLTLPIEQRKQTVATFRPIKQFQGDPSRGETPESDRDFETRQLERWRALCVIVQEESRAVINPKAGTACPEVAIQAVKLLFPDHPWPKPQTQGK